MHKTDLYISLETFVAVIMMFVCFYVFIIWFVNNNDKNCR